MGTLTIDQTLVNSIHGLLNMEIGGLEYRTRDHCIHMLRLFCNALVDVIYLLVSGQYSYTITVFKCSYVNRNLVS